MIAPSPEILNVILIVIAIAILFFRDRAFVPLILIFIYLLPRAGFTFGQPWGHPLPYGCILMIPFAFGWLLKKTLISSNKIEKPYVPPPTIFILYTLYCLCAFIIGIQKGAGLRMIVTEFLMYYAIFFIYFMIIGINIKKADIKLFINGLLLVAFLVSCYGILLHYVGETGLIDGITYNDSVPLGAKVGAQYGRHGHVALIGQLRIAKRTLSSYGDPNVLATQVVVFISIILALILIEKASFHRKIFLYSNLILNFICLYLTDSRSGLASVIVVFLIFAIFRHKAFLFISILSIISFLWFSDMIFNLYKTHRFYSRGFQSPAMIFNPRFIFKFIQKYPLGAGFGSAVRPDLSAVPAISSWHSLNSFHLHVMTRIGLFGIIVLAVFIIYLFVYFLSSYKNIEDSTVRAFVFGGTVGLIIQQLCFAVNNIFMLPGGGLNFLVLCGMVALGIYFYKKH